MAEKQPFKTGGAEERDIAKLTKEKRQWLLLSFGAVFVCALAFFAGIKTRSASQFFISALFAYITVSNFRQYRQKKENLRTVLNKENVKSQ